jgi:hypothetical protein
MQWSDGVSAHQSLQPRDRRSINEFDAAARNQRVLEFSSVLNNS